MDSKKYSHIDLEYLSFNMDVVLSYLSSLTKLFQHFKFIITDFLLFIIFIQFSLNIMQLILQFIMIKYKYNITNYKYLTVFECLPLLIHNFFIS